MWNMEEGYAAVLTLNELSIQLGRQGPSYICMKNYLAIQKYLMDAQETISSNHLNEKGGFSICGYSVS